MSDYEQKKEELDMIAAIMAAVGGLRKKEQQIDGHIRTKNRKTNLMTLTEEMKLESERLKALSLKGEI